MSYQYIYDFLMSKIGNSYGVCGLMGNLYVESSLRSMYLEGSYSRKNGLTSETYTMRFDLADEDEADRMCHDGAGYGIAQWTYWSRKKALWEYARKRQTSIGDLYMQMDYLWDEIQKYQKVIPALSSVKSVREASDLVCLNYEKPKHTEEKYLQNRADYGQKFYDLFSIKMETKGASIVNSANYVDEQLKILKNSGIPRSDQAWKLALLTVGWAYVFGAYGEYCDPSNRRSRYRDDHPTIKAKCQNFNGNDNDPKGCVGCKWFTGTAESKQVNHEGRTRFFDCRGFIYFILHKLFGFWDRCPAGATTMWNTESNWASKGLVKDGVPNNVLVCLFYPDSGNPKKMAHVGFGYHGETVECSNGVQHFTSYNKKWTHWAVPKCVVEEGTTIIPSQDTADVKLPMLKKGDRGEFVTLLQTLLLNRGYKMPKYGADGSFGDETLAAVKQFQQDWGLNVDGVVGETTWKMLETSPEKQQFYTVTIPHLSKETADDLLTKYTGAMTLET